MNKVERPPTPDSPTEMPQLPPDNQPHKAAPAAKSRAGRRILGIVVLLLLAGALGIGVWRPCSPDVRGTAGSCGALLFASSRLVGLLRAG